VTRSLCSTYRKKGTSEFKKILCTGRVLRDLAKKRSRGEGKKGTARRAQTSKRDDLLKDSMELQEKVEREKCHNKELDGEHFSAAVVQGILEHVSWS